MEIGVGQLPGFCGDADEILTLDYRREDGFGKLSYVYIASDG